MTDADPARSCPVCQARRADILHRQPFVLPQGHPLQAGYAVVCCQSCGFVYADSGVAQETYDRYYAELSKYEDGATATGGGKQSWDRGRLADVAALLARWIPGRMAKIVDVGCANAGLLRELSRIGYCRLYGVDPSPRCALEASRVPGGMGAVATLFTLPARLAHSDCVILSHVLEHLQDVRAGLGHAVRLLRSGGVLYVEVPDATRYADCLAAPLQDFNTEHLNHFGASSLRRLLEGAGLEVRETGHKTIAAAEGIPYPALYAVGVRAETAASESTGFDSELRPAIVEYVRRSTVLLERLERGLAPLADRGERLFVWGVGQLTFKLLAMTSLARVPIGGFIDSSPRFHGRTLRDVLILPPAALTGSSDPILIATLLHTDQIIDQIGRMALINPVLRLDQLAPVVAGEARA